MVHSDTPEDVGLMRKPFCQSPGVLVLFLMVGLITGVASGAGGVDLICSMEVNTSSAFTIC